MPKKHGLPHGLATFVSVSTAGLLIAIVRPYLPFFIGIFDNVGLWLSNLIGYPPGEPILIPGEGEGNFETFPAPAFVEISWK